MNIVAKSLGLALLGLITLPLAARADDDCDQIGRHYRADLVPIALTVADVAASGDVVRAHQSVAVRLRNAGTVTIDYAAQPGDIFHAVSVSVAVAGGTYTGWLRVPFAPGAEDNLLLNLPANAIRDCANVALTIDTQHTARQSGCNVYNDDSKMFPRVLIQGRIHRCAIIHGPFPGGVAPVAGFGEE